MQMIEKKQWWRCGNACVIVFPRHSMDTRREQTDNVEENDMQMDDKRKGTGRSTEGKPLKMTRMTPQKAKQMKHRTEISTFLGFSNIWRNKGERSPFRILQSRRGTSCYRDGPEISTGRPLIDHRLCIHWNLQRTLAHRYVTPRPNRRLKKSAKCVHRDIGTLLTATTHSVPSLGVEQRTGQQLKSQLNSEIENERCYWCKYIYRWLYVRLAHICILFHSPHHVYFVYPVSPWEIGNVSSR